MQKIIERSGLGDATGLSDGEHYRSYGSLSDMN